jgi:hypothetical protein
MGTKELCNQLQMLDIIVKITYRNINYAIL